MKNFTLAEISISIPYLPALRPYAGSVTACILMQQLDFWFSTRNGAPFYKFLAAQKGTRPHPAYKPGDSWCEELLISPDEFRCAFEKIGCRYKSYSAFRQAGESGDTFQGQYYASYHDRIHGLTWYLRNHDVVDSLLFELFTRKSRNSIHRNRLSLATDMGKPGLPNPEESFPKTTEITTENTPETTATEEARSLLSGTPLEKISDEELLGLMKGCCRHDFLTAVDIAAETWRRTRAGIASPWGYLRSFCTSLVVPEWYVPFQKRKLKAVEAAERKAAAESKDAARKAAEAEQATARHACWESLSTSQQEKYLAAARADLPEELTPPVALLAMAKVLAWEALAPGGS